MSREWIEAPYSAVEKAFVACQESSSGGIPDPSQWLGKAADSLAAVLSTEEDLKHVPLVTRNVVTSGWLQKDTLVRYVGMVQDIFAPDFYVHTVEERRPGRVGTVLAPGAFRDEPSLFTAEASLAPSADNLGGRISVVCVPLPGEAAWARAMYTTASSSSSSTGGSSGASSSSASGSGGGRGGGSTAPAGESRKRRAAESSDSEEEEKSTAAASAAAGASTGGAASGDMRMDQEGGGAVSSSSPRKQARPEHGSSSSAAAATSSSSSSSRSTSIKPQWQSSAEEAEAAGLELGHPLIAEQELPCLIRFYSESLDLKVGDLLECIAIYSPPSITSEQMLRSGREEAAAGTGAASAAVAQGGHSSHGSHSHHAPDGDALLSMLMEQEQDIAGGLGGALGGLGLMDSSYLQQYPPARLMPVLQCVAHRHLSPAFPLLQPGMQVPSAPAAMIQPAAADAAPATTGGGAAGGAGGGGAAAGGSAGAATELRPCPWKYSLHSMHSQHRMRNSAAAGGAGSDAAAASADQSKSSSSSSKSKAAAAATLAKQQEQETKRHLEDTALAAFAALSLNDSPAAPSSPAPAAAVAGRTFAPSTTGTAAAAAAFQGALSPRRAAAGSETAADETAAAASLASSTAAVPSPASVAASIAPLRGQCLSFLTEVCGGDEVAAEFLLLHLFSRVAERTGLQLVGKLSLEIFNLPSSVDAAKEEAELQKRASERAAKKAAEAAAALARALGREEGAVKSSSFSKKGSSGRAAGGAAGGAAAGAADADSADTDEDDEGDEESGLKPLLPLEAGLSPAAARLHRGLSLLLPRIAAVPLSRRNTHSLRFAPEKDLQRERLLPGLLQLPRGTQLLVDTCPLIAGRLSAKAANNLQALRSLITDQELPFLVGYDSPIKFEQDTPCLLLSSASCRGLLPVDAALPLSEHAREALSAAAKAGGESGKAAGAGALVSHFMEQLLQGSGGASAAAPAPFSSSSASPLLPLHQHSQQLLHGSSSSSSALHALRLYLASGRQAPFTIPPAVSEAVTERLAALRKENASSMQAEDMHRLLTIARLLSLSYGETALTLELWARAQALEEQRSNRCKEWAERHGGAASSAGKKGAAGATDSSSSSSSNVSSGQEFRRSGTPETVFRSGFLTGAAEDEDEAMEAADQLAEDERIERALLLDARHSTAPAAGAGAGGAARQRMPRPGGGGRGATAAPSASSNTAAVGGLLQQMQQAEEARRAAAAGGARAGTGGSSSAGRTVTFQQQQGQQQQQRQEHPEGESWGDEEEEDGQGDVELH